MIGTGASAFQFVPQHRADRSSASTSSSAPRPGPLPGPTYHHDVPEGKKWLLEHVPFYGKWYRFWLFWRLTDGLYDSGRRPTRHWAGGPGGRRRRPTPNCASHARRGHPRADSRATTTYFEQGRPAIPRSAASAALVDNGVWLEALKRDNVDLITTPIERITPEGVLTKDGAHHRGRCAHLSARASRPAGSCGP